MGDINEVDWVAPALRATPTQKYYLLQYMEARPHLAQKEFGTAAGRKDGRKEWETLSETLNNLPGASIKTCDQWIKYWDDQRTAVRGRAARVRNHLAATGGGRPLDLLTDYDRRVLALDGGWLRVAGFTSDVDPLEVGVITMTSELNDM
ncbi:Amyloid-beta A4 protein [Frankliniella fusca]|uniref:Regulatory protein zeste n=1 Tax=Frankliniella fusca TaxID=407009 RepID=A0AAE1HG01_9NEOP|nr:Amyloid-beta A4 protein [Frankliniella fusca]